MEQLSVHEQKMMRFGCPTCKSDIELYDTNDKRDGGRYKCTACGRDTVWQAGKAYSVQETIKMFQDKIKELDMSP